MDLQNLKIAIRPRRDWEAVDLGLLMARQWWLPMVKAWLIITSPLLIISFFMPLSWAWLPAIILWWFKPLFERPLLMILSQGVFAATPSTKAVVSAFPRLALKQIFMSLTFRRLSPSRSMDLAVIQLENLDGYQRSERLNTLHRDDAKPATWLTLIGIHIEGFLFAAMLLLLAEFTPTYALFEFFEADFWVGSRGGFIIQVTLSYIASALVAPFYVACGFSLYLNRRVKLEGWDIEIAFKRMMQKRGFISSSIIAVITSIGLISSSLAPSSAQAEEQELQHHPLTIDRPLEVMSDWEAERRAISDNIIAIKDGDDFHQRKTITQMVNQQDDDDSDENENTSNSIRNFFKAIGEFVDSFAFILEVLLWAAVIGVIFFVAVRYRTWLYNFSIKTPKTTPKYKPTTMFGMEVTQNSLPADISNSALALWQQSKTREALALLYRASLSQLLNRGLALHDGSTEQECLNLVKHQAAALNIPKHIIPHFSQVTELWRLLAYAHIEPNQKQVEELCSTWNDCWLKGAHHDEQ